MNTCELKTSPTADLRAQGHIDSRHVKVAPDTPVALNTLLVATDFSRRSSYAFERALRIAAASGTSKASLLHVLADPSVVPLASLFSTATGAADNRAEDAQRQLRALADRARHDPRLAIEHHVAAGDLVGAIGAHARGADLTVLGAQGAHPLRDFALGSTAQRLLRATRQPVLAVRRPPDASYRQALVAVDLSVDPGRMLAYARALAPHAMLNLVHVHDVPYQGVMRYAGVDDEAISHYRAQAHHAAARRMRELVLPHLRPSTARVSIVHGYVTAKLLDKERELDADLVIVTKRAKSLAEELLVESVALQLLARAHADVLVVR